ncbi:hypothetical protein [Bradyrhizobium sp. JYMT SZCCT0428]|uniref:hypothetical protein n=1 Tax=Bradyrhizobium sp. JYMT SZCCT0428 TaxID=2807673 RepID=UPI001BAC8FEC|nr:hypothetical protein [Bradyrhizobium sp. JYMT SZCCT0428]MBR1150139.1 hypothetical protein [Bradyrhizobium sp. JYMT SZCCT0428]
MTEPMPRNYDYQGNERCLGYVRGVTSVPCKRCRTTGVDPVAADPGNVCGNFCGTDIPVCRSCGGYGCVPSQPAAEAMSEQQSTEVNREPNKGRPKVSQPRPV